jgi:hypothetical protein
MKSMFSLAQTQNILSINLLILSPPCEVLVADTSLSHIKKFVTNISNKNIPAPTR